MSNRNQLNGSITVEMTLLFPIILFVIVSIILFSFYLCDVVSVRAKIYEYCISECNNNASENIIANGLQKQISKYMLISNVENIDVNKKDDAVKIEVCIKCNLGYFNISRRDAVKVTMHTENTRQYVVKEKVFSDTINDIK